MRSAFGGTASGRFLRTLLLAFALAVLAAPAAQAQPFGTWLQLAGFPAHGYAQIPHSAALNPTTGFTFEAWVSVRDASGGCSSIAGKNWEKAWWVGICPLAGRTVLRSYVRGYSGATGGGPGTFRDGGDVPANLWTHVAVVFNGTQRLHYINGELADSWPETGPLTTSTDPVRIGSDVAFQITPAGGIDEVHLWNVPRNQAQIRADLAAPITAPQTGLVAVWHLDGNVVDSIGGHNGVAAGTGVTVGNFAALANCLGLASPTALCLQNRFLTTTRWRTSAAGRQPDGNGQVVINSANSGLFWFFSADNWEVMVKSLNGCPLNSRHWIFSAATTNVFYRMDVLDVRAGVQKIYFNYPGPPAPAVTDTNAFATCP